MVRLVQKASEAKEYFVNDAKFFFWNQDRVQSHFPVFRGTWRTGRTRDQQTRRGIFSRTSTHPTHFIRKKNFFLYSYILIFLYSYILIFFYSHILIFLYSFILIYLYSYILIFLYSYILIFLYSYILIYILLYEY